MTDFFEPSDPEAFVDFPPMPTKKNWMGDWVVCPKCFGHGGWNLSLNNYPLCGENTAENWHKYCHFRASCSQCNGYGWTSRENAACIHEWLFYRNTGRCLNEQKCSKCGTIVEWDSSD